MKSRTGSFGSWFGVAVAVLLVASPAWTEEPPEQDPVEAHGHEGHDHRAHGHDARHHGADPGPDHPDHMAHHRFDDAERWSKIFDDPARDAWQMPAHVVALMDIEPGMTVADIGAGTGYFLGPLAGAVGLEGRVLGLDVEPTLVDHMTERASREGWARVEARVVDKDDLGLPEGSVDRFLVVNTWHHILDREAYGEMLRRILSGGGRVVVVDYTMDSPSGPKKAHRLLPEQVMDELRSAGFEVSLLEENLPRQYVVVGRVPAP